MSDSFNLELSNARVEVFMPNMDNQTEMLAKSCVWGEWNMENTLALDGNGNIVNSAGQITDPKIG